MLTIKEIASHANGMSISLDSTKVDLDAHAHLLELYWKHGIEPFLVDLLAHLCRHRLHDLLGKRGEWRLHGCGMTRRGGRSDRARLSVSRFGASDALCTKTGAPLIRCPYCRRRRRRRRRHVRVLRWRDEGGGRA
eukprot:6203753-Pleurochrysis_carterae.AAC.2